MIKDPPALVITGPTASGKTALSIDVARGLHGEIISVDSRQIYRGMDIGTAKATAEQRAAVPHHGLDLVDPDERFSAGRFARYARQTIDSMRQRGRLPILVGGTGFFLRALTHPIFREPPLDPVQRDRLAEYLESRSNEALHHWLSKLDPPTAERLRNWGGRQRLLRAIEIPLLTGRTLSWWHANSPPEAEPLRPLVFVLGKDRSELDQAIEARVGTMMSAGLVAEVAGLVAAGFDERAPGMNATGYVELLPYLRGDVELEDAVADIRRNTRAYARRQMTWLRNQLPVGAIWIDAGEPREVLVERIVATTEAWLDSRPRPS
jgi:tRNA dimethylallyltransferase